MSQKKREKLFLISLVLIASLAAFMFTVTEAESEEESKKSTSATQVSGQGEYVFELDLELSKMPEGITVQQEKPFHGGFAVDRREGKGEVYFGLKGVGVVKLSNDLKTRSIIPGTQELLSKQSPHNATIFYDKEGKPFLSFPLNKDGKVIITDLQGKVIHTLTNPQHNDDYKKNPKFSPTDTDVADGKLYIVTGYGKDYVLTADPFTGKWLPQYFGGKGVEDGKFNTGHGVTTVPGEKVLYVSDRANSREQTFDYSGTHKNTFKLPGKCMPCDIDFHPSDPSLAVVGCLNGPNRDKSVGAPIYILKNNKVISTILPKKDLGVNLATYIHNAAWKVIDGKNYILCQSWNPGHFFVLKQVNQ